MTNLTVSTIVLAFSISTSALASETYSCAVAEFSHNSAAPEFVSLNEDRTFQITALDDQVVEAVTTGSRTQQTIYDIFKRNELDDHAIYTNNGLVRTMVIYKAPFSGTHKITVTQYNYKYVFGWVLDCTKD